MFYFAGLKDYLRAQTYVNAYNGPGKDQMVRDFYGDGRRFYNGILATVWTRGTPGIWVWTNNKLKFFVTDQYSVYSFYDGCTKKSGRFNPDSFGKIVINREISTRLDDVKKIGVSGDFISVMVTEEQNGGKIGNLRELWLNNWWAFLGGDLNVGCKKLN